MLPLKNNPRIPMFKQDRIFASIVLVTLCLTNALAQSDIAKSGGPDAATVTASASGDHVRFTAPSSIVQIRLEVYSSSGKKLFDNEVRGNVLDWSLQDAHAQPLPEDSYLCVITTKSLSGKLSQTPGSVRVERNSVSLQPVEPSQMTPQQAQAIAPAEENIPLTMLEDQNQTTTVIAHNGDEGQITRGKGALSFRVGDFFSGRDIEQMRLTAEGSLGIGITHPQVRLDVDGFIRASQGTMFPDGTIQTTVAIEGNWPLSAVNSALRDEEAKKAARVYLEGKESELNRYRRTARVCAQVSRRQQYGYPGDHRRDYGCAPS